METIFNFDLVVHNVLSIMSAVIFVGLAVFTYLNNKKSVANITFSLIFITGMIFCVSQVIGVNISDPIISRNVLMFNLCLFPAGVFQIHSVLNLINKDKEYRLLIYYLYVLMIFFISFFLIYPDLFLLPSEPKMYFPNYYVPGVLNMIRLLFIPSLPLYSVYHIWKVYRSTQEPMLKNQYKYLALTLIIGYPIIFIPNFLVYNIEINPSWGMLSSIILIVPFLYGAVKYELFNVKIIAKQAFVFSLIVVLVGGIITLFNYSNQWIQTAYPTFPIWITPLISAILAVIIGVIIWERMRESDLLKYEFISTVTHKFRTPLTHIKWASENLQKESLTPDQRTQVEYIENANGKLVELTSVLMNTSGTTNSEYHYRMEKNNLKEIVEQTLSSLQDQLLVRRMNIEKDIDDDTDIICDSSRIRFVTQTFIENAIHYSPEGGLINIKIKRLGGDIICSVKDSGIGIPSEELDLLFSKFYRGKQAKLADTEGMGIGLFMSKEIISKHGGKIWVESEGPNKGSTFSFTLPEGAKP